MPFRDTEDGFKRAAERRLSDARELMEKPTWNSHQSDADRRHLRGAMYLAGYAIECYLKAYLIRQMNAQTLEQATEAIDVLRVAKGVKPIKDILHTAAGHQIVYLVGLTDIPLNAGYVPKLWGRLGEWQSSWRYESDYVRRDKAETFMDDVQTAVHWLLPKLR